MAFMAWRKGLKSESEIGLALGKSKDFFSNRKARLGFFEAEDYYKLKSMPDVSTSRNGHGNMTLLKYGKKLPYERLVSHAKNYGMTVADARLMIGVSSNGSLTVRDSHLKALEYAIDFATSKKEQVRPSTVFKPKKNKKISFAKRLKVLFTGRL